MSNFHLIRHNLNRFFTHLKYGTRSLQSIKNPLYGIYRVTDLETWWY